MIPNLFQLLALLKPNELNTDSATCKLIHKGLMGFLLYFTMHCLFLSYHDQQLNCINHRSYDMGKETLNSFCWNHGVYTYTRPFHRNGYPIPLKHQKEVYPGVRNQYDDDKIYHIASKFIGVFFAVSAFSCYFGRYLWEYFQSNVLMDLISTLSKKKLRHDELQKELDCVSEHFIDNIGAHGTLCMQYGFILLVYLLFLCAQFFGIIGQHDGEYFYGYLVFQNALTIRYADWPYKLQKQFPIIAMCDYSHSSVAGNKETFVHLCDLPNSYAYQLMLAIHWFLLIPLIICVTVEIITHVLFINCPTYRAWHLISSLGIQNTSEKAKAIRRLNYGSAFVIKMMLKNISRDNLFEILSSVDSQFRNNKKNVNERQNGIV